MFEFLLALVVIWNGLAGVLGALGLVKPAWRPTLAHHASQLAKTAVGASVVSLALGALALLIAPEVARGGLFFAFTFWAFGGLFPFTMALLLSARVRDAGSSHD